MGVAVGLDEVLLELEELVLVVSSAVEDELDELLVVVSSAVEDELEELLLSEVLLSEALLSLVVDGPRVLEKLVVCSAVLEPVLDSTSDEVLDESVVS